MCKYIFSDHTDHGKQNNFGKELFQLYLEYLCATFLPVFTYTVHVGHLSALLLVLINILFGRFWWFSELLGKSRHPRLKS